MNDKIMLGRALTIMTDVHKEQYDKAGYPYMLHPIRVMQGVDSIEAKIVALLHDVIEDTDSRFQYNLEKHIYLNFPEEIYNAVELLTKSGKESYDDYIDNIIKSENRLAIKVKLADLMDNMNKDRLNELPKETRDRLIAKYTKAYDKIINSIEGKSI